MDPQRPGEHHPAFPLLRILPFVALGLVALVGVMMMFMGLVSYMKLMATGFTTELFYEPAVRLINLGLGVSGLAVIGLVAAWWLIFRIWR